MSDTKTSTSVPDARPLDQSSVKVTYGPIPPPATFTNYISVTATNEEIQLDLCELRMETAKGGERVTEIEAYPRHRVLLTPQHAIRLVATLTDTLVRGGHIQVQGPPAEKK